MDIFAGPILLALTVGSGCLIVYGIVNDKPRQRQPQVEALKQEMEWDATAWITAVIALAVLLGIAGGSAWALWAAARWMMGL